MAETPQLKEILYIAEDNGIKLADGTRIKVEYFDDFSIEDAIIKHYIRIDDIRARIGSYTETLLTDPNKGHWDLWDLKLAQDDIVELDEYSILELKKEIYARNPKDDVSLGITVAIDFGTKSTVVVRRKSDGSEVPINVGPKGRTAEFRESDGENPTILQFLDIPTFQKVYNEKLGRPNTNAETQLEVSKYAINNLTNATKNKDENSPKKYNQFITDLKQWTHNKQDSRKMTKYYDETTNKSEIWDMKPYLDLADDDLDPVEVYAYALSMYINNMNSHKICFDYYLSFPVNYEKPVREKIRDSFENGIKKSLPSSLLNDDTIMDQISVLNGGSEPAAYAVSALYEYKILPQGEDKYFYSVFDFGGGTTDFDFGVWREADEDNDDEMDYSYVIEHFGPGGGKVNLGGENLLSLLAFELFKKNLPQLFEKGIKFVMPAFIQDFANSESYISKGANANLNTKTLMEELRPFWENGGEFPNKEDDDDDEDYVSNIEIKLYSEEGVPVNVKLFDIPNVEEDLKQILEKEINDGLDSFFQAMSIAFKGTNSIPSPVENVSVGEDQPIKIFLAGNSSKSTILKELLTDRIRMENEKIARDNKIDPVNIYNVYPPLGTDEAIYKIIEDGHEVDANTSNYITGKTGVAFGLLKTRKGGPVLEKSSNDDGIRNIKFKYFVGKEKSGDFKIALTPSIEYNQWVPLKLTAKESTREIRFSLDANVTMGNVDINTIPSRKIRLPDTDKTCKIFIRAVDATVFEFTAAENIEAVQHEEYLFEPQAVHLDKEEKL